MLTSILRTIVPALWGSIIGWVLSVVPLLEPLRADLLAYGDLAVPVIGAILIGGWYAFWRWLEPHLPDWLTRILLGSAKMPVYKPTTAGNLVIEVNGNVTTEEAARIAAQSTDRVPGPDHRA